MKNYSVRKLTALIILIFILIAILTTISFFIFTNVYIISVIFIALVLLSYFIIKHLIYSLFVNKIIKILHTAGDVEKKGISPESYLTYVENKAFEIIKSNRSEIESLKSKEKFRKEFLGNISHELKTPVFSIQGYILTLIDGGIKDENINTKYLNLAEKNINRLIEILNDLDKISKLETGEIDLKLSNFNITEIIKDTIESLDFKTKDRNIKIIFNTDKKHNVYADKYQITTLISNLIRNSINYGNENGKTVISISEKTNLTYISVKDNGIGIPDKDITKIFDRFYRVDKSRSRDLGGSGLGLSIVKHIIEAHKQKIEVKSKLSEGTEFIFTLNKAK